jgi:hypothetical protein
MLPDWPRTQTELQELVNERIRLRVHYGDPVLAQIGKTYQHEGQMRRYETVDGEEREMRYRLSSASITLSREDLVTLSVPELLKKVDEAADQLQREMVRTVFARVSEAVEAAGNVIDNKGQPFTFETFIAALEKIHIDFDEETGMPIMPTLHVAPQLGERLRAVLPEWEKNEEYTKRYEDLIARKRQEWNDREADRKLVD